MYWFLKATLPVRCLCGIGTHSHGFCFTCIAGLLCYPSRKPSIGLGLLGSIAVNCAKSQHLSRTSGCALNLTRATTLTTLIFQPTNITPPSTISHTHHRCLSVILGERKSNTQVTLLYPRWETLLFRSAPLYCP